MVLEPTTKVPLHVFFPGKRVCTELRDGCADEGCLASKGAGNRTKLVSLPRPPLPSDPDL